MTALTPWSTIQLRRHSHTDGPCLEVSQAHTLILGLGGWDAVVAEVG